MKKELNGIRIRTFEKERKEYFFQINNEALEFLSEMPSSASAGVVYVALCKRADNKHKTQACFPSKQTIAKDTGISIAQVSRAILQLEKRRMIAILRSQGNGNLYFLLHPSAWTLEDTDPIPVSHRYDPYSLMRHVPASYRFPNKTKHSETYKKARHRGILEKVAHLGNKMRLDPRIRGP